MRKIENALEVANLICRFGDDKKLLDLFEEIVWPAFSDRNLVRTYGLTDYRFYQVTLMRLDQEGDVLGVAGRFIKNTTLLREQTFDNEHGLVRDEQHLQSAPSAIFVLLLPIHRLLYVKETRFAPGIDVFKSTLERFLFKKHKDFVDATYEKRKSAGGKKATKKNLLTEYPWPSLEVVALATESSLQEFIKKYDVLKRVEIQLLETNDEVDNDGFWEGLRARQEAMGSTKTSLTHNSKEGLNKDETIAELAAVATQGNHSINLNGKDGKGHKLKATNNDLQVKTPIVDLPLTVKAAAATMYSTFEELVSGKLIKVPSIIPKAREKVKLLLKNHDGA